MQAHLSLQLLLNSSHQSDASPCLGSVPLRVCFQVGFVASFVSKFSDTVSSEIGKVLLASFSGLA